MSIEYKNPKRDFEQIEHLKKYKRVVFNGISEEKAKEILIKHNYINVISPFKYNFALKDKEGKPIKDSEGRHIYERDVDFNEYYQFFINERSAYPTIYANISRFESVLKATLAYETINFYEIKNSDAFKDFIDTMLSNLEILKYEDHVKDKIAESLNKILIDMEEYNDVYILFDRLSFNETAAIFRCVIPIIQTKVFNVLDENDLTFDCTSISQLDDLIKSLVPIRNYVCHENSLTILKRYYDIKNRGLRTANDRHKWTRLINKLSKEKVSS